VYELVELGASVAEIAAVLELDPADVRREIMRAEGCAKQDLAERVARQRSIHVDRLEDLLAAVWQRAVGDPESDDPLERRPSMAASEQALRILRRQSALLGLDAPVKHAVAVDATVKHGIDLRDVSDDDLVRLEATLTQALEQVGSSARPRVIDVSPGVPGAPAAPSPAPRAGAGAGESDSA
jgi:hypothetical protein